MSATALARSIRAGERTSVDVVEAHIAAIERINPALNAMVRPRFDTARAEAAAADARVAAAESAEELPPLLGVPCTIKECFGVEGMPQSSGLLARANHVARADATTVRRIKEAGAVILGVSNISELCMWMESDNRVYGRTNNPYDPTCSAGGSSGGEASLVGAGVSPWGLGSDVGGSIRIPAGFCGVFGHKPSGGLVPATGQFPKARGHARRFLTTGPIARRAEDLLPLLRILAGPDGWDGVCEDMTVRETPPVTDPAPWDAVHVAGIPDRVRIEPTLLAAASRAAEALSDGDVASTIALPRPRDAVGWWAAGLSSEGNEPYAEMLNLPGLPDVLRELARVPFGRARHTVPSLILAALDRRPVGERTLERVLEGAARARANISRHLGDGVLLCPSFPMVAPRHRLPMRRPFAAYTTLVFNVLELPVTQVPMGLDELGRPVGVQVVAAHGRDDLTIAAAQRLEARFGGWYPPPRLWP